MANKHDVLTALDDKIYEIASHVAQSLDPEDLMAAAKLIKEADEVLIRLDKLRTYVSNGKSGDNTY